tara:strand:+ start:63 stop:209 length:147 start_codon:yes stop_codon:yes gene_type:complete
MRWWKRRKKLRRNIIKITVDDNWFDLKLTIVAFLVCLGLILIIGEAYS